VLGRVPGTHGGRGAGRLTSILWWCGGSLCGWWSGRFAGFSSWPLRSCDRIATAREAGWPSHDVEPYPASLDVRTASRERKGKPANRAPGCSVRVASAFNPRSGSFWGWVWVAPPVGRLYAPKDGVQPQGRGSSKSRLYKYKREVKHVGIWMRLVSFLDTNKSNSHK